MFGFSSWISGKLCLVRVPGGFSQRIGRYIYAVDLSDHTDAKGDFVDRVQDPSEVRGVFKLEPGMKIRIQRNAGGRFNPGFWGDGEIKFQLEGGERHVRVGDDSFLVEGIHPDFLGDRTTEQNWVGMFEDEVEVEVWREDFNL